MESNMTDKKSRRVMIFNNIKSDTIDQAIFILKSSPLGNRPSDATAAGEAQEIINSYVHQVEKIRSGRKRKKSHSKALGLVLFALGFSFVGMIIFYLFSGI